MALADQIQSDLTTAMKARDELRVATLRTALAGIKEAAVAGTEAKVLDDDDVRVVLAREVKKRDEAAEAFAGAGRAEQAARELAERAVLAEYLPAALTSAEIATIVDDALAAGGFASPKDMGAAMKAVNAVIAGRADGRTVADLVKARLAG